MPRPTSHRAGLALTAALVLAGGGAAAAATSNPSADSHTSTGGTTTAAPGGTRTTPGTGTGKTSSPGNSAFGHTRRRHRNPVLGKSVVVGPSAGKVTIRRPGASRFVALSAEAGVPVGSVVDAAHGAITLTSAVPGVSGGQTASFRGGRFRVVQSARTGVVDLSLVGGSFRGCPVTPVRASRATVSAASYRVVRRLWGHDHRGRFRTHGRNSVATVRGTVWLTEDRCDGTLTRVLHGTVLVRAAGTRHWVVVRAGHSYLAPARHRH